MLETIGIGLCLAAVVVFLLSQKFTNLKIYYSSVLLMGFGVLLVMCQVCFMEPVQTKIETENTQIETKKTKIEKINVNLETEKTKKQSEPEPRRIDGRVLWVGDSRTVQLENVLTWYPEINEGYEDYFICQGSMGYNYFVSTCIPTVNSMKQAGDTIVMNMGVNDLANIDLYIETMNALAESEWSDCTIIYMTPNPVLDSVSMVQNYQIEEFNSKLQANLHPDIIYLDTFTELLQTDFLNKEMDAEGVHYSNPYNGRFNTYEFIYRKVREYTIA